MLARLGAIGIVLLSWAGARLHDEPVTIKRNLVVNTDAKFTASGTIAHAVTFPTGKSESESAYFTCDVDLRSGDEIKDGNLPFTLTLTNVKLTGADDEGSDTKGAEIVLEGTVDERNDIEVEKLKGVQRGDQGMTALVARIAQGIGTFPTDTVKPGDTWTVSEQGSFLGAKKLEYSVKFDGPKKVDEVTFNSLSTDTDVPIEVDLGSMDDDANPGASPRMALKGTVHIDAQADLDLDGVVNKMVFDTRADIVLDSPDANGQIKLTTEESLKLERQR